MAFDVAKIQERIDLTAASRTEVSTDIGGIKFSNMIEVLEFSKMMAVSETAVPKHLRGNPGMCLAVCVQALEWRFSPFAVANKSYVVNDRIGYESQLVHAVIEQRAPIIGRLLHRFEGEGDDRRCIVTAKLRETGELLEYISPPFGKIQPKNSPLWKTKPDLQLYYNSSRDFCRAYFPDVLLGVYSQEELRDHVGPDNAKEVNERPSVGQRLKGGGKGRGFNASHVERETRNGVVDETTSKEAPRHSDAAEPSDHQIVDSNSSQAPQPLTETDTPAAALPPEYAAGTNSELSSAPQSRDDEGGQDGVTESTDVSTLAPDWQDTYIKAMERVTDRPKSLLNRHTEALQMIGGKANNYEQEWMKAAYRLTERRLKGEITKAECDAAIREITP